MHEQKRSRQAPWVITLASAAVLALAGCQSAPGDGGSVSGEAVDDGSTITMWTRSSTADLTQLLVDAYNDSHDNQVELTVIPFDSYQQKVGAAAGGGQLPDILSSDVVFTPNYASKALFADITDRIDALPFAADLAPAHIAASTLDGAVYGVPHAMDLSAVFYNKKLFEAAGLDPDAPPTTLTELAESARTIAALGDDTYGFTFGGNCGGCLLFGSWPSVWAAGGEIMNDDGTESLLDSPEAAAVYQIYRDLYDDGTAPADARTENGSTQTTIFEQGKMGMQVLGATQLTTLVESDALEIGVFPIPGPDGGESSFIGGDTVSISATSQRADQAWDFIAWTLGEEAQVEVVARSGNIPARTDLAVNSYTEDDPRAQVLNGLTAIGKSPVAINFGATYNDPNGPWLALGRAAIFGGDDVLAELEAHNLAVTESLQSGS